MMSIDEDVRSTVAEMVHELDACYVFVEVRDAYRRRVLRFEIDLTIQSENVTVRYDPVPPMPEALDWNYPIHVYVCGEGCTVKRKVDRLHQLSFLESHAAKSGL